VKSASVNEKDAGSRPILSLTAFRTLCVGWFGARAFTDAAALNRREIDLAGDVRTMPEAAEILTEALGRPIAFAQTPIEQVRQYSKDTAIMLEWFERVGYSADIAGLEREFGRVLTKLPDWARRHARPNGQGELA
jgi:uncharacterized protein YbjT (DUF2867 family)